MTANTESKISQVMKTSTVLVLVCVILPLNFLWYLESRVTERAVESCQRHSGVPVKTATGYECLKRDTLVGVPYPTVTPVATATQEVTES